ncbi:MAG: alcohol dehydrogenase catalytic domain-containing protein [Phycisphaerae bacterium]|nr:alcohol dehydrogenase catalytic domain-containing protein [Phycisphaerae bacterium]
MLALVYDGTTRLESNSPEPRPRAGEALLRVRRAGVCSTDIEITRGYMNYRGILGHEFVADVVSAAKLPAGTRVAVEINCVCGACDMCAGGLANHCRRRTVIGIDGRPGAFAELIAVPERNCHRLPDSIGEDEAVFVEPLAAAVQITRQVKIEPRSRVAVLGSGRLGLLVAQVLARTGCRLIVIGRNPLTLEFLDRKGITAMPLRDLHSRFDQDFVVDCTGSAEGLDIAMSLVRPRGTIVMKTTCAGSTPVNLAPLVVNEVTLLGSRCGPFADAIAMLARREVDVASMITRRVPLARGVEALRDADDPRQIKVIIEVATIGSA